jgi:hypothetical protein
MVEEYVLDSCGSEQGTMAGSCEHGNELSDSIKDEPFVISSQLFFSTKTAIDL